MSEIKKNEEKEMEFLALFLQAAQKPNQKETRNPLS